MLETIVGVADAAKVRSASGSSPPKLRMLVKYPGSKWKIMARLVPLLPYHEHFVSVFGGSGAEILAKPRSMLESYNDLDSQVHNVFSVVHNDQARELRDRIAATPNMSQKCFRDAAAILKQPISDPVLSAWAFIVVGNQGNGTKAPPMLGDSDFGYATHHQSVRSKWQHMPSIVDAIRRRFQKVQLFQEPYQKLFKRFNRQGDSVCWLLDPPYHPSTLNCHGDLYTSEMTDAEHGEFLDLVLGLHGHALVFNYANDLYNRKLKNWRRVEFPSMTNMAMRPTSSARVDVCWMNFDHGGRRIVSKKGGAK
jgi:DNA adenine methylase